MEIKISVTRFKYQEEDSFMITFQDITEEQLEALKNQNEYQKNLLASCSHELRTPLNCSIGHLEAGIADENV